MGSGMGEMLGKLIEGLIITGVIIEILIGAATGAGGDIAMDVNVTLTSEECNFIHAVLHGVIGGPPEGPRRIGEQIAGKIPWPNPKQFRASIQALNRFGSRGVVVESSKGFSGLME